MDAFAAQRICGSALVLLMGATVWYGIAKLKRMQADYDRRAPVKDEGHEAKPKE
jgi:hypothetical protein